jgi:hypothetical protein
MSRRLRHRLRAKAESETGCAAWGFMRTPQTASAARLPCLLLKVASRHHSAIGYQRSGHSTILSLAISASLSFHHPLSHVFTLAGTLPPCRAALRTIFLARHIHTCAMCQTLFQYSQMPSSEALCIRTYFCKWLSTDVGNLLMPPADIISNMSSARCSRHWSSGKYLCLLHGSDRTYG